MGLRRRAYVLLYSVFEGGRWQARSVLQSSKIDKPDVSNALFGGSPPRPWSPWLFGRTDSARGSRSDMGKKIGKFLGREIEFVHKRTNSGDQITIVCRQKIKQTCDSSQHFSLSPRNMATNVTPRVGPNIRHMVDMGQGLSIKPLTLPTGLHVLSLRAIPSLLGIRY